jgi:hypothetical protein
MPSGKNPAQVVNPGPGKLPAGTVTASALLFPPGGGSGAALTVHITDPTDAHMASAIGVNPTNAAGLPVLTTAGGTVDGESVLDFIDAAKDLFPTRPNEVGFDSISIPNTGKPVWYELDMEGIGSGTTVTGGFTRGAGVVYTHHIAPLAVVAASVSGMVYPADRGILAIYYSTTGDYTTGTLIAALWLGSSTPPVGVPPDPLGPIFLEQLRPGQQFSHSPLGVGLDRISLSARVPYLNDYSSLPVPWIAYDANFTRYQVAAYEYIIPAIGSGDAGSWLVVHWKESYATTLAAIQPAQLATHLNPTDCYSATTPDLDTAPGFNTNRHNVFVQTVVPDPVGVSFTTAVNAGAPVPTTVYQSGVRYYNGNNLRFDINIQADNLFDDCYYTGTSWSPNGPPDGFQSLQDPLVLDLGYLGIGEVPFIFSELKKVGAGSNYSTANPPLAGDTAELTLTNYSPTWSLTGYTSSQGYSVIRSILTKPIYQQTVYSDSSFRYLFNSYYQVGTTTSTDTFEPFNDEKYRYNDIALITPTKPIEPAGGDDFNSTTIFVSDDGKLQICGGRLIYPSEDYSSGLYLPAGPDYATVKAGDSINHHRVFVRAFDTGMARNTGRIRLRKLEQGHFESSTVYYGNDSDHPNFAIVEIKVPGLTGWLDLGRDKGNPDLTTADGRGCRTAVEVSGSDVTVTYDTTEYTATNSTANGDKYLLFVRVTLMNNGSGPTYYAEEIEWLAP